MVKQDDPSVACRAGSARGTDFLRHVEMCSFADGMPFFPLGRRLPRSSVSCGPLLFINCSLASGDQERTFMKKDFLQVAACETPW